MADITYQNFDLLIERVTGGYRAKVNSPEGEAANDFRMPFTDEELVGFIERVSQPWRSTRAVDSPELDAIKDFGGRLFTAVFDKPVYTCFSNSLATASRLRIRLRLKDVPELAYLPWEYLYDSFVGSFLALSSDTPIVRYMEMPRRIQALGVKPPLRVLVMISSPTDEAKLDVEAEWSKLTEAVDKLTRKKSVVLERLENATLLALRHRLRERDVHIFHFIGHGKFDPEARDGILMMEDEEGKGYPVSGQLLGMHLHEHRPLRLAVLNACEGARASLTDAFGGIAQSLVQQGIPAVLAMQFKITDQAAITFASEFYGSMADYYPVDAALAQARLAIRGEDNHLEWATPALYMRSTDGRIFDSGESTAPGTASAGGATGVSSSHSGALPDQLEVHYATVLKAIAQGAVVPFLGADASQCGRIENSDWREGGYLPSAEELAAYVVEQFALPGGSAGDLVRNAQLATIKANAARLYAVLHSVFESNCPPTSLHTFLATLPALLREKGHPARYQLIVTTNFDDMLERAYRDAGVPYDVVSYEAEGEQRGKFWHWKSDGDVSLIELPNQYQAFSLEQRAVILKVHGAFVRTDPDRDSYVITEDHFLDYLTRTDISSLLPVELAKILRKSHFLFLGSRLPEWNLRVIFHRIWREQRLTYNSWAIPFNLTQANQQFWLNRNVDVIKVNLSDYVEQLAERIKRSPRVGEGS
ncbi:MAG TPA: CHAT domain-containing protein [Blastocatellia bacterium]|nr:CHAT domain-containing protein [Blastocatellia bacterium]